MDYDSIIYGDLNTKREGPCAADIMRIYSMLPTETNFTLQFLNFHHDLLETINFLKFDPKSVKKDHIKQIKKCFQKYGSSGYTSLNLEWNHGFGEAVLLKVVVSPDKEPR